jgi:hypothetical protein
MNNKNNINLILADISDFLDKKNMKKISSRLDKVNKNILKIKTAQY